jgi:hypothetical protein
MKSTSFDNSLDKLELLPHYFGWVFFPIGDSGMQKVNVWSFYVIGYQVHRLTRLDSSPVIGKTRSVLVTAREALQALCDQQIVPFPTLRENALEIIKDIGEALTLISKITSYEPKTQEEAILFYRPTSVLGRITTKVKTFETLLAHELSKLNTFYVPKKGTHDTADLLERAVDNLSVDVRSRLSKEVIEDVNAAGRCLALDSPTACGFHILRAVEPLIVAYHNKVTGKILPKRSRNWGQYIIGLKGKGSNADPKVIGMIQHIKDFYRNPIMHPEETLTLDEALSLFYTCLSAIVQLDAVI